MSPAGVLLRGLIRGYQLLVSPILPASCRFMPSCSAYAMEAVAKHGAVTGGWLAAKRVCRCHPWNDGGFDPVPELKSKAVCGEAPSRHPD
ncbi:MAG: membrane protein insertion efficiency factor YidD [Rhodospirillaceae bacterium]|nr:membrane protein insertion efficiency factor YidD [Rhodospirillales bacterium]